MKTFFKAVEIGPLAGYCTLFVILILFYAIAISEYFDYSYLLWGGILSIPAMPLGIIGALIGWYWRKTGRATWVGGLIGGLTTVLASGLYLQSGNNVCILFGGC